MRIYRLFKNVNPDNYCLLVCSNKFNKQNFILKNLLPAQHFFQKGEISLKNASILGSVFSPFLIVINFFIRTCIILRGVKKSKANVIFTISGDLFNFPACLLVSKLCKQNLVIGIDDDYIFQWTSIVKKIFARFFEPVTVKNANCVIVLSDFLREEYKQRYKIKPFLVYNPNERPIQITKKNIAWPLKRNEVRIVFTGSIYHANYDAFLNLIEALKSLNIPDIKLHIYSAQSEFNLKQQGISGPVVFHGHRTPSHIDDIQKKADILFLPLGFNTKISEVIKTSSPFKMGEYLTSGRPILVHAPADSFLSWYFKKNKCGAVVDQSNPKILLQAIKKIIDNPEFRKEIVNKASQCSETDFALAPIQKRFFRALHFTVTESG